MQTINFITSFLTFYLKGEIQHEQNFIKLKIPNTFLTFIPLGARKENIPVNQIGSVDTNFRLQFKTLLQGVVVAFIGLACISDSVFMGMILLILGVLMSLNAFQTELSIKTTSGNNKNIFFIVFQKAKAEQAAEIILNLISGRLDDTNVRQQGDRQTDKIVEAIANSRQ